MLMVSSLHTKHIISVLDAVSLEPVGLQPPGDGGTIDGVLTVGRQLTTAKVMLFLYFTPKHLKYQLLQ